MGTENEICWIRKNSAFFHCGGKYGTKGSDESCWRNSLFVKFLHVEYCSKVYEAIFFNMTYKNRLIVTTQIKQCNEEEKFKVMCPTWQPGLQWVKEHLPFDSKTIKVNVIQNWMT